VLHCITAHFPGSEFISACNQTLSRAALILRTICVLDTIDVFVNLVLCVKLGQLNFN
jgi:hypothetical protein